jgi:alpha-tubulin suppressor-like RCC1 family protein
MYFLRGNEIGDVEARMTSRVVVFMVAPMVIILCFGCTVKFEQPDAVDGDAAEVPTDMHEDGWDFTEDAALEDTVLPEAEVLDVPEADVYDVPEVESCGPGDELDSVVQISAGSRHTCALIVDGGVKCWGDNAYGQIGDGSTADRLAAVDVVGLGSLATAVAAGGRHTCAIMEGGGVMCWGDNSKGQLGNGSTTSSPHPVSVQSLSGTVTAISLGDMHTCVLLDSGGVKCWGRSDEGQLGNGTFSPNPNMFPVDVSGLSSGVWAIAAGVNHTCAVLTTGYVKCWGSNNNGQIGNGEVTNVNVPKDVSTIAGAAPDISGGGTQVTGYTCARRRLGSPMCWGDNTYGQLGDGTHDQRSSPVPVSSLDESTARISAGGFHTCAVRGAALFCWGSNQFGQLGDGTTDDSDIPALILAGVSSVSLGQQHTCVLWPSGGVSCWGLNSDGQLGDGTATERHSPTSVLDCIYDG